MTQSNLFQKLTQLFLALSLVFSVSIFAQNGDAANGKKLFNANCSACHKLDKKILGPPLKGISEKREKEWLHKWIKDNIALIKSGDALAKQVFEENNKMPMTAFPQLSTQDIDDILAYTDDKPAKKTETNTGSQTIDPKVAEGKKIFKANCVACHKLDKKLVGPPLKGISEKREREWLHKWIKDNNALRNSGDALAKQVFEENNKMPMTAFPQLSEQDIDAMLAYFKVGNVKKVVASQDNKTETVKEDEKSSNNNWMTWVVAIAVIGLLAFMLFVSKNGFLKIVALIGLILIITYLLFNWLMGIGIDQGYQPIQPIAFSHKVHAGDNKIDCQYCHSSAKHSKTSGVPTANVCMNCHKSISEYTGNGTETKEKTEFYTAEIQKIYNAVGWDADNFKYKENYEEKPIEWIRVHNLPDFAYYNHSQHVTVAGIACQKCHGPVEEMDDMRQFAPLTMAWCLDCHKETDVNMENGYYKNMHKELSEKYDLNKVTIAEIGGKECAKCHY